MTNSQIITQAAQAHGFTAEQLQALTIAYRGDLPFHTFAEWKSRGYHVKRGEHALFTADLWKYTDKPSKAQREAAVQNGDDAPASDGHYYLKTSYIFGAHQVEPDAPAAQ